jgi:hypothetical protein
VLRVALLSLLVALVCLAVALVCLAVALVCLAVALVCRTFALVSLLIPLVGRAVREDLCRSHDVNFRRSWRRPFGGEASPTRGEQVDAGQWHSTLYFGLV